MGVCKFIPPLGGTNSTTTNKRYQYINLNPKRYDEHPHHFHRGVPPVLDLCAPCLVEFTLQKIQLCVKTLGTDISARQAVVLRPTVVIVDAFTRIPVF